MGAPKIPEQKPDPELEAQKARANADNIAALQERAAFDTSQIMARYGTMAALAGGR